MKKILLGLSALSLGVLFMSHSAGGVSDGDMPAPDQPTVHHSTAKVAGVSDVVTAALDFKNTLTTTQQATLEQTYTTALARKWSNLPCGAGCRNGIEFGNLNATQLQAALAVIQAATGTSSSNGYDEFVGIRMAEANLHANGGGSGYDTMLRWISFLNTPSATGQWMLQFGGHHYAANIAFNNGHVVGATPYFMGVEPLTFTVNNVTYAPLNDEHDAMTAMLASLTTAELTTAKITNQTFSDCTLVPGETNGGSGTFPTTKVGVACSNLTAAQQALVLTAIQHYTGDMDTATAAAVQAVYANEIGSTYIAYTGNGTSGNASSFLSASTNYVRIDGPTVWIEMSCQAGVVYQNQIHYHTIWRDHSHDYGVDLAGTAIDGTGSTAITDISAKNGLNIYPNPSSGDINLHVEKPVSNATILLYNAATGQRITVATQFTGTTYTYNASGLASGLYILQMQSEGTVYTGKFTKL